MLTSQFIAVSGGLLSLDAFAPVGDTDLEGIEIQTLTAGGATDKAYTWNTWMYSKPCWVDSTLAPVTDVAFDRGNGVWVFGTSSAQNLQTAGAVCTSDIVVQLRSGGTATGNPFPVSVALEDIMPVPFNNLEASLEGVEIQTLTAGGATDKAYTWNTWMYSEPCWVDSTLAPVTGVTINPGEGLWIFGTGTDQAIRFPAPEL